MNLSSLMSRRYLKLKPEMRFNEFIKDYEIHVDFLKGEKYIPKMDDTVESYYLSLVKEKMVSYLMNKFHLNKDDLASRYSQTLNVSLSDLIFHVTGLYDYESAQVSVGGYQQLASERTQYLGEILDYDGLCGGYNLRLFITQAYDLARKISRK